MARSVLAERWRSWRRRQALALAAAALPLLLVREPSGGNGGGQPALGLPSWIQERLQHQQSSRQEKREQRQKNEEREAAEKEAREQLKKAEEEAVRKAEIAARHQLNRYEQRRIRRRVRSANTGGTSVLAEVTRDRDDWPEPMNPFVRGQLKDAVQFFCESMRVPAALIASAAVSSLFMARWTFKGVRGPCTSFVSLERLYYLLTAVAVCAELTAVLVNANAHARLLALGRSDLSLEPTALDLIMAHIEFEYLTISLSFLTGIMAFIMAALCHVVAMLHYANDSEERQNSRLAAAIAVLGGSSLLWWLHLANVRLVEFGNLGRMAARFLQLLFARAAIGEIGIVGSLAVLGFIAFIVLAATALCEPVAAPQPRSPESTPTADKA